MRKVSGSRVEKVVGTLAAVVSVVVVFALAIALDEDEPKKPAPPTELSARCTCAGKPEGCEVTTFIGTGSPTGPVAYCAMWAENGRDMACCVAPDPRDGEEWTWRGSREEVDRGKNESKDRET